MYKELDTDYFQNFRQDSFNVHWTKPVQNFIWSKTNSRFVDNRSTPNKVWFDVFNPINRIRGQDK